MKNYCVECKYWSNQNSDNLSMKSGPYDIGSCSKLENELFIPGKFKTIKRITHVSAESRLLGNFTYTKENFGCNNFILK